MKRIIRAAAIAGALLASGATQAEPLNLTLAGASPQGLWTLIGVGLDKALRAADPASSVTYQSTGGGFANVGILQAKKVDLALVHNSELRLALDGQPPFKEPQRGFKAIAVVYDFAATQIILTQEFAEKHGIRTMEDIARKKPPLRLIMNRRGNINHDVYLAIFDAYGIKIADIEKWGGSVTYSGSGGMDDAFKDRRIDMMTRLSFVPTRALIEVPRVVPVTMLPITNEVIAKVTEKLSTGRSVVKAGAYDWLKEDVPAVTLSATVIVRDDFSEEAAYRLTKALIQNLKELQGVTKAMEALTLEKLVDQDVVPFHPGAARAYREAGLLKK